MAGITYVRLCPQLASDIRLDETSDEVTLKSGLFVFWFEINIGLSAFDWSLQVLVEMLWRSQAYMHEQRDQVNLLVKLLDKAR